MLIPNPNLNKALEDCFGGANKALFSYNPKSQKVLQYPSHRMFAAHAWSIKCKRKEKLIAQFGGKLRDERFKPN